MKSFLNRRSAGLSNGASHLVAVEPGTPPDAAHAASGGVVVDDGAPRGAETLVPN
ncbi:hypothetical protein [Paraburkholderia sacchari]|uniref:Uncharacterized protein n=1 Tax=Paraburkholderia sacchari TaxID=159450 RepID=A0A8T6Z4I6_9BURK|nr:hypothetical protein [Paraburkholderia sacchari]NLP59848.1 hypothetical protein [Paraburkholderia sacchari]